MTRTREQPGGDFLDFVLAVVNAIGDISKQEAGDAIEREWKARGTPRCDCGRPLTMCTSCAVEDYQASQL